MKVLIDIPKEMYEEIIDESGIDTMLIPFRDIIKNGTPLTPDVVEREKIDKAIEEIEQLINHSKLPTVNIYNRYSEGLKDCLEILKRNIGE